MTEGKGCATAPERRIEKSQHGQGKSGRAMSGSALDFSARRRRFCIPGVGSAGRLNQQQVRLLGDRTVSDAAPRYSADTTRWCHEGQRIAPWRRSHAAETPQDCHAVPSYGRNPIERSIPMPSRRAWAHVIGRSCMSPLASACSNLPRASRMILRCSSEWKGTPKWWPIIKGTNTARGGLACSVISRATVMETVGTPLCSIARCTSATD